MSRQRCSRRDAGGSPDGARKPHDPKYKTPALREGGSEGDDWVWGGRRRGFMVWGLDPPRRRPLEAICTFYRRDVARAGKQCDRNGKFSAALLPAAPITAIINGR